ncbi:MAG: DUF3604 domain-containing protein [Rhizobiaceae bacterium]
MSKSLAITTALLMITTSPAAFALEVTPQKTTGVQKEYSPHVNESFPQQVFWGDTHVHTTYSPDAGMLKNFNLGPAEAYQMARGEQVTANNGMQAKLVRPLDFLVVSDHSEYMGLIPEIRGGNPEILKDPVGKQWSDWYNEGEEGQYKVFLNFAEDLSNNNGRIKFDKIARSTWDFMTETADQYNDPGNFTAFIGYEWTSTPKGDNMHRVVIFKDDAEKANRVVPFSSFDSADPEDLWKYLANYEDQTGGRVMAIPHNGNVSNGAMFDTETRSGNPINADYAKMRMRFERLHEMTQMKGDSETHPVLSPNDEFADYGTWDKANLTGEASPTKEDLPGSYARSALKRGMEIEAKVGANPYKHGFIGSTDSHTSLATAGEMNFFGKASIAEPYAGRWDHVLIKSQTDDSLTTYNYETLASGLAAVWARENTRESLFDAMERRETYATTGPRMTVRNFCGFGFQSGDVHRADFARHGYETGAPMGGELTGAADTKAPTCVIRALRDPDGANLDRLQIVKGWLNPDGTTSEQVYNVTVSDGREIKADGSVDPVGNTVDLSVPTYTNTIGDSLLFGEWTDPDFDPAKPSFYYVRVLEIPTPTWAAKDAVFFNVKMPKEVPMMHQERAYTSPIWYMPNG